MNNTAIFRSSIVRTFMIVVLCISASLGETWRNPKAPFAVGNLSKTSFQGSETLLPDGRLLRVGGTTSGGRPKATLSMKDPQTGAVTELSAKLFAPRAGHSATVLPDGTVLILGGVGTDGNVVSSAEVFDPVSETLTHLASTAPVPRTFHTATLLTDGRLLIAGGVFANGKVAKTIELWDPRGKNSAIVPVGIARWNHQARLLPDGRVLFTGGQGENSQPVVKIEGYDPQSRSISSLDSQSISSFDTSPAEMRASSPEEGAQNVPLDALISVRFSRPVQMLSVNATTVTVEGPTGSMDARVVAAEGGMLAFISPSVPLTEGSTYGVKISGAVDQTSQNVAYAEFTFSTAGTGGSSGSPDGEEWTPASDWRTHRPPSKYESLEDLKAAKGETALAGQVLRLNGEPLSQVTLQIGNERTRTDSTGRFLLTGISTGHQVLVIEGESANSGGRKYGRFEFGDEIKAGVTNHLDFKIWMTPLDMTHEITVPSPTTKETILRTPTMPGLELHLPAGTVITDSKGKTVTKITITPVPLDRPPFPLPFVQVPIYFTIQPGGAYIAVPSGGPKGARLFYPNTERKAPGVPFAFWNYSADQNGWSVYGKGVVSPNQAQIVPDPGVVIYEFSGAMVGSGGVGPTSQPGGPGDGEPVMLSSGLFVYSKTDLTLADVLPLSLTRTYRPNDSWSRPFGIGTSHNYEMFLGGDGTVFGATAYVDLIFPDGTREHFVGNGAGPSFTDYVDSNAGTAWYGAILTTVPVNPHHYGLPGGIHLRRRDGTIYSFPDAPGVVNPGCQSLVGITDRNGNQIKITRNADTNCTIAQITSPSGRYIQFQYDSSFRVKVATDNIGRQVLYNYDGSGRLSTVTDANGAGWTYGYDSLNRMTTIQDPRLITYLTNVYDSNGRVFKQFLADGTSFYQFNWTTTANTTNTTFLVTSTGPPAWPGAVFRLCTTCSEGFAALISQVDVIDPRGFTRRVSFNQQGLPTTDIRALSQPEQQTTTYTYYPDNLLNTVTDQLGRVTNYVYDANANLSSITRLSGTSNAATASVVYDSLYGSPLSVTDPLGNTTSISYDTYGNPTSVTDPLGHQTTLGHNGMGRVTSFTDPLQNTTQFAYDFADLIGVTDPLLNVTSMFHDGAGRVVTETDPLGHTTKYQFDNLNQVIQLTDPLQGITSFSYDPNGRLLTAQDARQQGTNNKTVYTYDNFDHLHTRTDPLTRLETYVVDQLGDLISFTDRRSKITTYLYDGLNRRTFAGYGTQPGPTYESTTNYTYDGGNRPTKVVDSASGTITPAFDGFDRLTSETTPLGSVAYTYDSAGRRKTTTVVGQPIVNYSYDNASRLYQITQGSTSVTIGLDNANRRSSLTLPNGVVVAYGYDNDSRVNSMSYQLGTTVLGNLTYTYNAAGRRTQVGGGLATTSLPSAMSSAVYDVNNELTTWNGTTLTYDNNGNLQSDGVVAYTWNGRNQLSSRGSTGFQYDSLGRRTLNAAGKNLLYENWDVGQELSSGTPVANRIVGGTDEFFSRADSSGSFTPITDALGSVIALADSSGAITTQYNYDPFGATSSSGAASTNMSQYTGRENDGNGLYYYRNRYYSPSLGRFISEDPIGIVGGLDLYAYVDDSPANAQDPLGLHSTDAHNQIIWNALHPCGVSNDDIWQIQQGSHFVDQHFQGGEYSYMHAMSNGTANQSAADAQDAAAGFTGSEMHDAQSVYDAGGISQSMFIFGVAMHPVMDQTSPAHTDYGTGNPRAWCGMFGSCSNTLEHGGDTDSPSWAGSIEDVAHLNGNPEVQELENFLIRTWYHTLTGRGCNCR